MKIDARLTFNKIRHDQDTSAHLVLTLTAPIKEGETARPNLCVVPVIDVSGSMMGDKLEYAKRSAIKLIDHLKPGDYCGLVTFDDRVNVVITPTKITNEIRDKLKAEIGKLRTGGSTNFAGGMLTAIELLEKLDLPDGFLHRVIMLTDGHANAGPATKPEDILKLLGANAGRVTFSAFGYGTDTDQNFLGDFARNGKGNYAFIRDPDGALAAFGKELGGLASTFATDLTLEVSPLAGHDIESVITDVDAESEAVGGEVTIKIPDVLAEEQRHIVLVVKIKEQKQAFPRAVNVFDIKFGYDIINGSGRKEHVTGEAKAKCVFVKPGEEDSKPDTDLDNIVALQEVIRAQLSAEEQAKLGNYAAAEQVMRKTAGAVRRRGRVSAADAADNIGWKLSTSTNYVGNQGYLRSFSGGGTRGLGLTSGDAVALEDLKGVADVQLSNSMQTSLADAFTEGANIGVSHPPVVTGTSAILVPTPDPLAALWNVPPTGEAPAVALVKEPAKKIRQARSTNRW